MGNTNSIPIISQVKSLVQVIRGDAAAAKRTQEEFARKGLLVSQLHSLGHSIAGNNHEARKIQEEFGKSTKALLDDIPVVGHTISAVHAIAGDTEGAKRIALGATKSTIDVAAGAACVTKGYACRHTLDNLKAMVTRKKRNTKVYQKVARVGGNLKRKLRRNSRRKVNTDVDIPDTQNGHRRNPHRICRRSIEYERSNVLFDNNAGDIPEEYSKYLPGSFEDPLIVNKLIHPPTDFNVVINTIFSIFFALKLMRIGHPFTKPFYEEVCNHNKTFGGNAVDNCQQTLFDALQKYEGKGDETTKHAFVSLTGDQALEEKSSDVLFDSIDALMFVMDNMVEGTKIGYGTGIKICNEFPHSFEDCEKMTLLMMEKLRTFYQFYEPGRCRLPLQMRRPQNKKGTQAKTLMTRKDRKTSKTRVVVAHATDLKGRVASDPEE